MTANRYDIRHFQPEDLDGYLDLYNRVFGFSVDIEWFQWKYEDPPTADTPNIIVAEYEGEIVGARSFLALRISSNFQEYRALQPCDTMVAPEHRKKGLFTRMNRKAIRDYESSDVRLFFNFPNENSLPGCLKTGWQVAQPLELQYRLQHPDTIAQSKYDNPLVRLFGKTASAAFQAYLRAQRFRTKPTTIEINQYTEVPAGELAMLHNRNQPSEIHAVRDEAFYDWKFRNPTWDYQTYIARENDESVAATIFATKEGSLTQTRIVESLPLQPENTPLNVIETLYREAIADHPETDYFIAAGDSIPERVRRRLGFLSDGSMPLSWVLSQKTMAVRSLTEAEQVDPSDPDNWVVSYTELDTT